MGAHGTRTISGTRSGLRHLGAIVVALALTIASVALLLPAPAHAAGGGASVTTALQGAASAIAGAQSITDGATRAVAAVQVPAVRSVAAAAGQAVTGTGAPASAAPAPPAPPAEEPAATAPAATAAPASPAPSTPARPHISAPPSSGATQALIAARLGQVLPSALKSLEALRIPAPHVNAGSLAPSPAPPGNPGLTTGEPLPLSGGTLGLPAERAPDPLAGLTTSATLSGAGAANALVGVLSELISDPAAPTPGGETGATADLSASSALERLVQSLVGADSGFTLGTRPLLPLGSQSPAQAVRRAALEPAAPGGPILGGGSAPVLTPGGRWVVGEHGASDALRRSSTRRPRSRPGSASVPVPPASMPPLVAGGASATPGGGIGSGSGTVALMAAFVLWLSQFIPGRVSMELKGWRSALLTLRQERPG